MRHQPQGKAILNRAFPGIVSAVLGNASGSFGLGPHGKFMTRTDTNHFVDPNLSFQRMEAMGLFRGTKPFSLMTVFRRTATNGGNGNFPLRYRSNNNVNGNAAAIGITEWSELRNLQFWANGVEVTFTLPVATASGDTVIAIGVWDKPNDTMVLYVNGVKVASKAIGTGTMPEPYNSLNFFMYHADSSGGSSNPATQPYLNVVYDRALSEPEAVQLMLNPWQVFVIPDDESELDFVRQVQGQLRKALYMNGLGYIMQSTSLPAKPLVLLNGRLRERIASEGLPVVLRDGRLVTLAPGEDFQY